MINLATILPTAEAATLADSLVAEFPNDAREVGLVAAAKVLLADRLKQVPADVTNVGLEIRLDTGDIEHIHIRIIKQ